MSSSSRFWLAPLLFLPVLAGCGSSHSVVTFAVPTRAQLLSMTLAKSDLPTGFRSYGRSFHFSTDPGKANGNQARFYLAFVRGFKKTAQDAVIWTTAWDSNVNAHRAITFMRTAQARKGLHEKRLNLPRVATESQSYLFTHMGQGVREVFLDFRVGRMVGIVIVASITQKGMAPLASSLARKDAHKLKQCAQKCLLG